MTLFPFFMNIKGAKGLIIGGGKHALEKIEKLLPYEPSLKVIAPEFLPQIASIKEIELCHREFEESDLNDFPAFVIAADNNIEENHKIASLCREKRIPVNVVDDKDYCDFVFPSLIARGNLSVGICTDGASPAAGVLLKKRFEKEIPDHMEEILDFLEEKRPEIKAKITDKKQRWAFYYQVAQLCMEKDRALTEKEWEELWL